MGHLDRQLSSKNIPDKRSLAFKYVFKRARSAGRRVNRFRIFPPAGIALLAAEVALGAVVVSKKVL